MAIVIVTIAETDIELATDNRLHAILDGFLGEFQRPEKIVGVGNSNRRRVIAHRVGNDLANLQRTFQQGIGGMDPQMDEARTGYPLVRPRRHESFCTIRHDAFPDFALEATLRRFGPQPKDYA